MTCCSLEDGGNGIGRRYWEVVVGFQNNVYVCFPMIVGRIARKYVEKGSFFTFVDYVVMSHGSQRSSEDI